jgi:Zn-dependent protease with chaperone function
MKIRFNSYVRSSSLAFLLVAAACSAPESELASEVSAHTSGEPTTANSTYSWAETDYATFQRFATSPNFATGTPLPTSTLSAPRLQAWADRIHEEVSKQVLQKTGVKIAAPKPTVVVLPAKGANAWVSGIPVCLTGEADVSRIGSAGRAESHVDVAFIEFGGVREARKGVFTDRPFECVTPTNYRDQKAAIDFFNASGSKCKIEPGAALGKVSVTGQGCELGKFERFTSAGALSFYAASPYVHVTTAMLALAKTEDAALTIVAHELGHYYRAHVVSELVMGKYNYWYEQKETPDTRKPVAASDSAMIEREYARVLPVDFQKIEGQKLSYRITEFLVGSLANLLTDANDGSSDFACKSAVEKLGDWRYDFGPFSPKVVKQNTASAYLAYEADLLACARNAPVQASSMAGSLSLSNVNAGILANNEDISAPSITGATLADILQKLDSRARFVRTSRNVISASTPRNKRLTSLRSRCSAFWA